MDSLVALLPRLSARPDGLAALRGLTLNGGARGIDALWAAPWLTQLTRLDLFRGAESNGGGVGFGGNILQELPSKGRALPALQELRLTQHYAAGVGFTPADAARLAACRLPALRRLTLSKIKPGALPPLMAAGWAAGLVDLSIAGTEPGWCGAAALARALGLTRLDLSCRTGVEGSSLDAAALGALLSAPWAEALQELRLYGQPLGGGAAGDAAARALAAAPLPRLRACTLVHTRLTAAGVAVLAAAPWLPGLTALTL
ncbi:MAG: hypothetical protein J3K34DRAFT_57929 [Monoraphidium minutum]|nr:MAG: hypothetical protein J3K34DRAFT_57929 [Monoraphidium minutum]